MRGKAVTVNVRMPKGKKVKRRRRQPYQNLKSTGWVRGTPASVAQFGPTRQQATPAQLEARKAWHYRGNGLYTGNGFYEGFGRDVGGLVGGSLGSLVGAGNELAAAGRWVGKTAADLTGWGAGNYALTNNTINGGGGDGIPSFGSDGPSTITVTHKEYVCDIFGPEMAGTFQNQTFSLNPALQQTFPWLSQIAANFDEYTFGQLMFTYRSTVTDFVATNGQIGSVIMATQYNAEDTPFQNKQDAMEYDGAISGKCSQDIIAGVECDPHKNSGSYGKYTRAGPVPQSEDIKTYDLGTLNVAISNTPANFANQAMGELWVSYTVQLRKPKFFVTRGLTLPTDIWVGSCQPLTPGRIDQMTFGVGQQNRIGTQLVTSWQSNGVNYPATDNTLYLVFPASFSGDIDVRLNSSPYPGGTTNGRVATISAVSNAGTGIKEINDLWSDLVWSSTYGGNVLPYTAVSTTSVAFGQHLRITSPATAQTETANDNVITIACTGGTAGPDQTLFSSLMVTVQVYNTGMNYVRVDQPIIANPTTGQIVPWGNIL